MKAFMAGIMLLGGASFAHAQADGDQLQTRFDEFDHERQNTLLRANRVVLDSNNRLAGGTTTDFGRKGFEDLTERAESELYQGTGAAGGDGPGAGAAGAAAGSCGR